MHAERNPARRLIVPLDVPGAREALALVERLDGVVSFFKVGLELCVGGDSRAVIERLVAADKGVFLDLKLPTDIPETIGRAVRLAGAMGVDFLTVSGTAATSTLQAAVAARDATGGKPRLLGVPLVSSLDAEDLGPGVDLDSWIVERARVAIEAGLDGWIASGSAIRLLRRAFGPQPLVVSPGIRPAGAGPDDHKRASTPTAAIDAGADYLVVGRPIRDAPDPAAAARRILAEAGLAR